MAALHQEKERIRTITSENKKLIERLVESKSALDNREPLKKAPYHLQTTGNKSKRVDSLNLVSRLKEHERIMNQN